ncbi:MAG: deoxynucleoside kinase [Deltaproteobacteria bacterium]|nr:deoxynucleoside kinase [Deltaproteobacteria bacterium]
MKRTIAVAGNIGAGKSDLVKFLCRRFGLEPFPEPFDTNPYLADFYRDMKTFAFRSQVYFLTHKFRIHRAIEREPGTVVQDRTIYEDAEIFARNLWRQRFIDKRDFATYTELYETIRAAIAPPDLMIYVKAPVRTLRQRIRKRGRTMEQEIPASYLRRLNHLYEAWFARYDLSPVETLATDKIDYVTDLVDRLDLLKRIERYL